MSELQVIETGELIESMSPVEAERITARIADKLDTIADNLEQVLPLIGEALTRDAWQALGYASPTAYVSERFAGALTRLPASVRQPVVRQLSEAGMSTRAIAPVVGASPRTVAYDLQPGVQDCTPETAPAAPPFVTGMDGKTYQRPEPRPTPERPRRSMAENLDDALSGLNLVLSMGDIHADLTPKQQALLISKLESIITRVKGEQS